MHLVKPTAQDSRQGMQVSKTSWCAGHEGARGEGHGAAAECGPLAYAVRFLEAGLGRGVNRRVGVRMCACHCTNHIAHCLTF